ncbi:hypothetical protein ACFLXI_03075 [Chloroflexota bacterium]
METNLNVNAFLNLKKLYENIYVIISPPRCSSTAFSRVFWEQPSIRYYSHEPFEVTYYDGADLSEVIEKLKYPLDLCLIKDCQETKQSSGLVIKEMPYQVGINFELLISLSSHPIMFLIRDPRLNISSRITKKLEAGQNPNFPLIETGWEQIVEYVNFCQDHLIPYLVIDSTDFRNCPGDVFLQIFEIIQLPFSSEMLSWRSSPNVNLDNLGGHHKHLYARVLESTGIEPATERIPQLEEISETNGFRNHVKKCMKIYNTLRLEADKNACLKG